MSNKAWKIARDPDMMFMLMLSAFNGITGVQAIYPEIEDDEMNEIARALSAARLVDPYVEDVDGEGKLAVNTKISRLGAWVLKPSWEIAA